MQRRAGPPSIPARLAASIALLAGVGLTGPTARGSPKPMEVHSLPLFGRDALAFYVDVSTGEVRELPVSMSNAPPSTLGCDNGRGADSVHVDIGDSGFDIRTPTLTFHSSLAKPPPKEDNAVWFCAASDREVLVALSARIKTDCSGIIEDRRT